MGTCGVNGYFLQRRRKRDRFKYKPTDDVGSENLYLYLICYEKEARVSRPSDENVLKTEWMLRKDKIEIALSSGNFGARDYAVFCADTEKQAGARTEKGMTYFGGDKAILNDYFTEKMMR